MRHEKREVQGTKLEKATTGAAPVRQHLDVMEPHCRYVQNFAFDQLTHKGLTMLQQRELQWISCCRVTHHGLVSIAIQFEAVTGREHGDSLAAGDLKPKNRRG